MITNENDFVVKLDDVEYEGPLDTLIQLIKSSDKNIYEISLVYIIDQFLKYVKSIQHLSLEVVSDFIVKAAELHYIKSRMLLPYEYSKDLMESEDPKMKLVEQLLEYQKFKISAETFDELQTLEDEIIDRKGSIRYNTKDKKTDEDTDNWSEVKLYDLINTFAKFMLDSNESELTALTQNDFTLEVAISSIKKNLRDSDRFNFTTLFDKQTTKRKLVVCFLAILELVRENAIILKQDNRFNEIYIFRS